MKKLSDKAKIGNIKLKNRLILAPMAGNTDAAFRLLASKFNAALTISEMISDHGFHYRNQKTDIYLTSFGERPLAIQIFGSSIPYMIDLAKHIDKMPNVDIIDINMGCPVPKVSEKSKAGSYYLKDPKLVYELVSNIVKNVKKPVTVKIRSGWDKSSINAVEVAKEIERAGASAITIHPRTRKEMYSGKANWDIIKDVKNAVNIPVIGNGDVKDYESAKKMLEETGCDFVMIGRATLGKPYIFKEILLEESGKKMKIDLKKIVKIIQKHYALLVKLHGEKIASLKMKTHISNYLKPFPELKKIRTAYVLDGNFFKLIESLKRF